MRLRPALWLAVVGGAIPAAAVPAAADVLIKCRVEADVLVMPKREGAPDGGGGCAVAAEPPRTGETVTLSVGAGRVRLDQPRLSVILREDRGRLYFLHPPHKKYSEIAYPVDPKKYESEFLRLVGPELARFARESATDPEEITLGRWKASQRSLTVANRLRNRIRLTYALSSEAGDGTLVMDLKRALHNLEYGTQGWMDLLPHGSGLPLFWEQATILPSSEVKYREEVVEIRTVDLPEDAYEVAPEYKKIEFDRDCLELR